MLEIVNGLLMIAASQGIPAADVNCIFDRIESADRGALARAALAQDRQSPAVQRLHSIADDCAQRLNWQERQNAQTTG